jgi:hypothetical protein
MMSTSDPPPSPTPVGAVPQAATGGGSAPWNTVENRFFAGGDPQSEPLRLISRSGDTDVLVLPRGGRALWARGVQLLRQGIERLRLLPRTTVVAVGAPIAVAAIIAVVVAASGGADAPVATPAVATTRAEVALPAPAPGAPTVPAAPAPATPTPTSAPGAAAAQTAPAPTAAPARRVRHKRVVMSKSKRGRLAARGNLKARKAAGGGHRAASGKATAHGSAVATTRGAPAVAKAR